MASLSKVYFSILDRFLLQNVCRSVFFVQQRSVKVKSREDALPEKPKQPQSTWLLFLAERRKELYEQSEYESMPLMQMSKKVGEEWRNFEDIDKKPYKEKYEETLAEYREKMRDYKNSLTLAQKRVLRRVKSASKRNMKEFEKGFAKPKFPGNGYILFVKSYMEENPPHEHEDNKERIRECASTWQNLDEDNKQRFNEQALPLLKKHREELKEWKEKYQEWNKKQILQVL